jgi:hypothetical protein
VFNQFGDLERCALRPGNVHSADGWEGVLKPVILRYRGRVWRIYFRADAAFRHRTANVPRDFAAHHGATAAATPRASMKRLIVTRSSAIDRRNASRCQ